MATIVQPYNPWKEQLALTALGNVAGNILSDLWQSHRQNEQNRKANAFRGQLQQNLQNNAQPEISLMPKEAPQGYNSNPWANALHQNYTPLTAFDIGTSTVGKSPSIQDIVQGADSLAASKRFSMLSPELVQGVKNSMIQQAETQRLRELQNNFADMFRNAKTPAEQMRALILANLHGFGDKAIAPFSQWAAHSTPHHQYQEIKAEDKIFAVDYDPADGSMRQGAAVNVGVNPTNKYVADSSARASNYSADRSANAHMYGSNLAADTARQELAFREYQQTMTDFDNQLKSINDSIAAHLSALEGIENENAREAYRVRYIAPLEQQKAKLTAERDALQENYRRGLGFGGSQATQGTTGTQTPQNPAKSNDVWFGLVGSPKGISIHPHGTFGYDRGDHKHGGIDITGVSEGTDIRPMPEMGSSFIVRQAYKSNSYGNNIVIESDRKINGKSLKFRIAHMQDGSLNLKPGQTIKAGDIIGKVGSTGRSTGPHIHLEVMVDGHLVDPQTFFQQFPLDNTPQTTATQQQPQTQQQPTTQSQPDREVMRDKDGTVIYQSELDEMIREGAKQGLEPNGVIHGLRRKGFEYIPEKRNVTSVAPALNWSPSYMGGIPQGQALTSAPLPDVQPVKPDSSAPSSTVTALNDTGSHENPFSRPNVQDWHEPLNPAPVHPVSADANPWSYVQQNTSPAWSSFDIHQPILGGQRQQPLPQQQTVSNDSRLSPLFSGKAINAVSDFLQGLNLTSGDENAVIPSMHEKGFFQYTDNPIPNDPRYNPHVSFPQGLPAGNAYNPQPGEFPNNFSDKNRRNFIPDIPTGYYRGGVETRPWSFADWFNRYANNEISFRPPLSALSYAQNPSNKSLRYYSGNMAGGLLPENAYDREKIDGEYQFLDTQLTALNGELPYWYGGPLSDDAYQLNFLLNSLGVTADKYPYIKRY